MTAHVPDIIAGSAIESGHVTVFPLYVRDQRAPPVYTLGVHAMAEGSVTLGEIAGGVVSSVRARNGSDRRVLFVDGDHLIGARQNRAVISSTIIDKHSDVDLPVCCVEQGRWRSVGETFTPANASNPACVRRAIHNTVTSSLYQGQGRAADQGRVWATVVHNLRTPSPTQGIYDSMLASSAIIANVSRGVPYVPRSSGLAIAVSGKVMSVDVFDKPATCSVYWKRIVDGVAHDAGTAGHVRVGQVYDILDELVTTSWQTFASVGCGREQRARLDSNTASLVELDGRCVHLGVAALH